MEDTSDVCITGSNFRVIHRLLMQVEQILEINDLRTVTEEVVVQHESAWSLGKPEKVRRGISKPFAFPETSNPISRLLAYIFLLRALHPRSQGEEK